MAYKLARGRIETSVAIAGVKPHSLVHYYGVYAALWTLVPALILSLVWAFAADPLILNTAEARLRNAYPSLPASFLDLKMAQLQNVAAGFIDAPDDIMAIEAEKLRASMDRVDFARVLTLLSVMMIGFLFSFNRLKPQLKARVAYEGFLRRSFFAAAVLAILTTIGIISSLLFEAYRFFSEISMIDFFFGTHWSPMVSLREGVEGAEDEAVAGSSGSFGMVPVMLGTLLVAIIAMLVAVPIGLFSAIYTADFASSKVRNVIKPMLEVLAGIPTVVYGFFAALTVGPFFRTVGESLGLTVSSESALAAGLIMGVMIIPYISSLSDDVINSVPQSLRDGSYAVGATKSETIKKVIIPAALPGIIGSILLAVSRAIGETMIVVMAAGLAANLTINPLESTTTITTQIVMILVGDQEFDSPKTQAAFALGLTLFIATLFLNYIALRVVKKYREKYD